MNELINDISSFTNVDFGDVRVLTDESGITWFFGSDVCRALGYARPWQAIDKNVDRRDIRVYEKGHDLPLVEVGRVPYGMQETDELDTRYNMKYLLINESGLYQLVCRSRKPEARAFMRWVTDEVLPSIRKRGMYIQRELLDDVDRLNRTIDELRADNARMKPRADYFDNYMQHGETMCITQIASMHNLSAQQLHKILKDRGVIRKVRNFWMPTLKYLKYNYMRPVMYEYWVEGDSEPHYRRGWEWTPKGEYFIHRLLTDIGYDNGARR